MHPDIYQIIGTVIFVLAIIHTFAASIFTYFAENFEDGSIRSNFFLMLGQIEVVFGLWSMVFILTHFGIQILFSIEPLKTNDMFWQALSYVDTQSYNEPIFIFVIMCMAATKPVIFLTRKIITGISKLLPLDGRMAFYWVGLSIGPLLGSFITEPATMTVLATLCLASFFKDQSMDRSFRHATLALLFVNVSIGGVLTNFAAPPVVMVATKWGFTSWHMFSFYGYKVIFAILISTTAFVYWFRNHLKGEISVAEATLINVSLVNLNEEDPPFWVSLAHLGFLGITVFAGGEHPVVVMALFLIFIGFCDITKKFQSELLIKDSLLVGFFLAGLVTLGSVQSWWIKEVLVRLNDVALYFGATALTAVTDNAALTYLGSLAPLTDSAKYNLLAGAVTGGGLTIIANAPNPAGYAILRGSFGKKGVSHFNLLLWGLIPTFVAILCFQLLP